MGYWLVSFFKYCRNVLIWDFRIGTVSEGDRGCTDTLREFGASTVELNYLPGITSAGLSVTLPFLNVIIGAIPSTAKASLNKLFSSGQNRYYKLQREIRGSLVRTRMRALSVARMPPEWPLLEDRYTSTLRGPGSDCRGEELVQWTGRIRRR